jgi:hypothetical protein
MKASLDAAHQVVAQPVGLGDDGHPGRAAVAGEVHKALRSAQPQVVLRATQDGQHHGVRQRQRLVSGEALRDGQRMEIIVQFQVAFTGAQQHAHAVGVEGKDPKAG